MLESVSWSIKYSTLIQQANTLYSLVYKFLKLEVQINC